MEGGTCCIGQLFGEILSKIELGHIGNGNMNLPESINAYTSNTFSNIYLFLLRTISNTLSFDIFKNNTDYSEFHYILNTHHLYLFYVHLSSQRSLK